MPRRDHAHASAFSAHGRRRRHVLRRDIRAAGVEVGQRTILVGREVDVGQALAPSRAMVHAPQVDAMQGRGIGIVERHQRLHAAGEEDRPLRVGLPPGKLSRRVGRAGKDDRHAVGHRHAIELLLPGVGRDFIVHQQDPPRGKRAAPADHDLPVDQPVIHAAEHDGHQGCLIALPPLAAA